MTRTTIPLLASQLAAAKKLYTRLPQWHATNEALAALGQRFPDFALPSVLLKVAAVNQLYGTNVYAVVRMAEHVSAIMAKYDGSQADTTLVEHIAALPPTSGQPRDRRHISFASKFVHFFIDAERFPIYDSYAVKMVDYHLGADERLVDAQHPYKVFMQNLQRLKQRDQISSTNQELDAYLWLAGLYWEKRRTAKPQINAEVARLFGLPDLDIVNCLNALLPRPLEQLLQMHLLTAQRATPSMPSIVL